MTTFKDLFSIQATDYAKFRPRYPDALFTYLASLTPAHESAWDCGTGNGQAAVELAKFYDKVIATDPSEKQLASAEKNPKVTYTQGSAEKTPFQEHSMDLVTVAQAFHWFKHEEFFAEVRRVLKPSGVVAIWSYNLCEITPEIDRVVHVLYADILGPYWEKERKLVEEGYKNCIFPVNALTPPRFEMTAEWGFEHLIGYLGTWSSLQTFIKKNGVNPLEDLAPRLQQAWAGAKTHTVRWELSLRVGRV